MDDQLPTSEQTADASEMAPSSPAAPQIVTPTMAAPQADAPQANAPQANAPQANAPQANAPQANAPQANAPQANAPQANAPQANAPLDPEAEIRRMSRRSFLWAGVAGLGTLAGFRWMNTRRFDDGIPWPLRRLLDVNGEIAQDYFSTARLAPTFPKSRAREPRVNGDIGSSDFDPKTWSMTVSGLASGQDEEITLAQIKKLPRVEFTTEMKCIEGWAIVVTWAGTRLVDFIAKYPPTTLSGDAPGVLKKPADLVPYVSAKTPDGAYFVGLDMPSALHPQTLLCYEMNGKPLSAEHGAPVRLVTPTKYGVKHLKWLSTLSYSAQKPEDYWAQRGYDWYAGH